MANLKKKRSLTSSNSITNYNTLDAKIDEMNIGQISDEDRESIIAEAQEDPVTVEVETSFTSLLIGDLLTFVVLTTGFYMILITVINSITEGLLR